MTDKQINKDLGDLILKYFVDNRIRLRQAWRVLFGLGLKFAVYPKE